jgi:peptidoglycan hydrolase-like protein with peptidoglycan-binding domain
VNLKRPLYGPADPRGPSRGRDVRDFVKRTLNRLHAQMGVGENFFPKPPGGFDDVYNAKTQEAVKVFQMWVGIQPATGQFGQRTLDEMWAYADAYSKWVYRLWTAPKPKPLPPELIEPYQGWSSLHSSLHEAYSLGRHMGLKDGPGLASGTYNPNSRLPSGAKSDHALYPARAFDLDIAPDTGWQNDPARAFFYLMVGRPEVNYVILGDRIWSRERASEGVRLYSGGGHANHVHVSGNR